MPTTSLFAGQHVREAQKYFVELYAAFQSWPTGRNDGEDNLCRCRWSSVHIDRTRWNVTAVNHQENTPMIYEFMQNSSFFPKGSCQLDSIFYVSDLDYQYYSTLLLPHHSIGK